MILKSPNIVLLSLQAYFNQFGPGGRSGKCFNIWFRAAQFLNFEIKFEFLGWEPKKNYTSDFDITPDDWPRMLHLLLFLKGPRGWKSHKSSIEPSFVFEILCIPDLPTAAVVFWKCNINVHGSSFPVVNIEETLKGWQFENVNWTLPLSLKFYIFHLTNGCSR